MRPLEITFFMFLLFNLGLLFSPVERGRFFWKMVLLVLLAGILQVIMEGYRWQLVPGYGFLLILALTNFKPPQKQFFKYVLVLLLTLTTLPPMILPVIELPQPTGPYQIGTETYHWIDQSREEWFTEEDFRDARELMVQVWYPAIIEKGSPPASYFDNPKLRGPALSTAGEFPPFFLSYQHLTKTHCFAHAPVVKEKLFPVLILSHGLSGLRFYHTSLIEELVSQGYIVVAPNHPYDANLTIFPDGTLADYRAHIGPQVTFEDSIRLRHQQLKTRVEDIIFILDQIEEIQSGNTPGMLPGHLDLGKVGILGHSFGGTTSLEAAARDKRLKACLVLDSWSLAMTDSTIEKGLEQPLLYMGRPAWPDSRNDTRIRSLLENSSGPAYHLTLEGTHHFDYTDIPLFSPFLKYVGKSGEIPGRRVVEIVNRHVVNFFDIHLKGEGDDLLDGVSPYPEVIIH